MSTSTHLNLPYIQPSQAQKHVTHNAALAILDALVQLGVHDRTRTEPPAAPAEGDRHIVAAGATGAWLGQAGRIAHLRDGAWDFLAPKPGFVAYVEAESQLLFWTGSAWADLPSSVSALQNLSLLGIGTTADGTNPFAAKLNKALWTARTAGEGGDGDLRYTLNKETASDVLSILMQAGFSGRAEFGLIGDDDLTLKVSADGSAWTTAVKVPNAGRQVQLPSGVAGAPGLAFLDDPDTGMIRAAPDLIAFTTGGVERLSIDGSGNVMLGKPGVDWGVDGIQFEGANRQTVFTKTNNLAALVRRNGSDGEALSFARDASIVGSIAVTTTGTTFNTTSDRRIKDDIRPLEGAGARIDALLPRSWIHRTTGRRMQGFVADEFGAIYPHAVTGAPDGERMQTMMAANDALVADLVCEVQSLRMRLAALEAASASSV